MMRWTPPGDLKGIEFKYYPTKAVLLAAWPGRSEIPISKTALSKMDFVRWIAIVVFFTTGLLCLFGLINLIVMTMKRALLLALVMQGLALSQASNNATLKGRLRLTDGLAAARVRVAVVRVSATGDFLAGAALETISQTDDSGNYRLENVAPGRYYVVAGPVDFPTYLPGVGSREEATILSVVPKATVSKVDFVVKRRQFFKVSGRVTGISPSGRTSSDPTVTLVRKGGNPRGGNTVPASAAIHPDGTFEFGYVLAGEYTAQLSSSSFNSRKPIEVVITDHDATSIEIVALGRDVPIQRQGLSEVWSLDGHWTGIVVEEKTGIIYAARVLPLRLAEIDSTGKVRREIPFVSAPALRLARYSDQQRPVMVVFGQWSREVGAYDLDGRNLWRYPNSVGVDDVWASDLNGDKFDEVILGYNAAGGIHVIDDLGKLVWRHEGLVNVWSVTADALDDGPPNVVTTSVTGQVHVFSADGVERKDIDSGVKAQTVRTTKGAVGGSTIVAIEGDLTRDQSTVAIATGLSADGTRKWSLKLSSRQVAYTTSAQAAPGKAWLAVTLRGGEVYVIDTSAGRIIGTADGFEGAQAEWTTNKEGDPLLIVANRTRLAAFRIQ